MGNDFSRGWDFRKELLGFTAPTFFLFEDRLAKLNAVTADVDVVWSFNQLTDFAVTLAAEGAVGILLAARSTFSGRKVFS